MREWLTVKEFSELSGIPVRTIQKNVIELGMQSIQGYREHCKRAITLIHKSELDLYELRKSTNRDRATKESLGLPESHPRMLQGVAGANGKMRYPSDGEWEAILLSNEYIKKPLLERERMKKKLRLIVNNFVRREAA